MKWPDDRAREEFAWLRLMARVKYDDYQDFLAGVRFVESLAKWLQQFDSDERFAVVYLLDDFMGTGTSFLRFDKEKKEWTGKLRRFRDSAHRAIRDLAHDSPFEEGWELCVHHYLANFRAAKDAKVHLGEAQ